MEQFFDVLSMVDNVCGVLAAVISLLIWMQVRTQKNVVVELLEDNNRVVLQFEIPRSTFSRAELFGRLGIYSNTPRFAIASLSTIEMLKEIDRATLGKDNVVSINLTAEEAVQFD